VLAAQLKTLQAVPIPPAVYAACSKTIPADDPAIWAGRLYLGNQHYRFAWHRGPVSDRSAELYTTTLAALGRPTCNCLASCVPT
jgi:hypothetical protein